MELKEYKILSVVIYSCITKFHYGKKEEKRRLSADLKNWPSLPERRKIPTSWSDSSDMSDSEMEIEYTSKSRKEENSSKNTRKKRERKVLLLQKANKRRKKNKRITTPTKSIETESLRTSDNSGIPTEIPRRTVKSPDIPTPSRTDVQNQYQALSDTGDIPPRNQETKPKIPPIILRDTAIWCKLTKVLTTKRLNYSKAKTNPGRFHTFRFHEEKPLKVVIRGLPISVSPEDIMEDLRNQKYPVISVFIQNDKLPEETITSHHGYTKEGTGG
ncbi:hypothetical protein WA026_001885 [Henosepilachna vigintioctopunctata]|uniref:Uncharacterized protein n=1 Tax=Henosepilachna vigintioctopunctata TaxID=420089 RepID=A0AAW1UT42_9CUCU